MKTGKLFITGQTSAWTRKFLRSKRLLTSESFLSQQTLLKRLPAIVCWGHCGPNNVANPRAGALTRKSKRESPNSGLTWSAQPPWSAVSTLFYKIILAKRFSLAKKDYSLSGRSAKSFLSFIQNELFYNYFKIIGLPFVLDRSDW